MRSQQHATLSALSGLVRQARLPQSIRCIRPFSSTVQLRDDPSNPQGRYNPELEQSLIRNDNEKTKTQSVLSQLSANARSQSSAGPRGRSGQNFLSHATRALLTPYQHGENPHHLHVYSHKHNTHITLTRPNREPMISLSCGNIGFRKAQRGEFDASHQLSVHMIEKIQERGFLMEIKSLEIILRGFGTGRESFTKVLLSAQGQKIRDKVIRVSDSTRVKFGGTRSRNVRRL